MCHLCKSFAAIIALIVIIFVLLALAHATNRGKQFPSFRVESASLNELTINGSRILETEKMCASLNITLSVSDPYQYLSISYQETLNADVFYRDEYGDVTLNTSTIQPFNGSMTELKLKVDSYEPLHLVESIVRSRREHGRVEFGLKVFTSIRRFKKHIFVSNRKHLKYVCYPLSFGISKNVYNSTPAALLQGVTCTRT
jgi:hypothetical protein